MLRCLAIDDEALALELLEDNISKVPFLELIASTDDPLEALKMLQANTIDLVFLDIQMPGLTGLQLINSLSVKPMFILVTAYEKFALDGFDLNVVDYLVKPVALPRFIQACNKARELHLLKQKPVSEGAGRETGYMFINVDYSHLKVVFADITWIEGFKDYIKIYLKHTPHPVVARMSMKGIEDQLPAAMFIRIQKSYIVSRDSITAVRKNSVFIGTTELPIGENYKEAVNKLIGRQPE